ncbi:MAG TPA: hypothetical protein VIY28_18040 [Pseudonocardiaceae bacterium]
MGAGDHAPLPYLWPRLARLLGQSPEQLQALIGGPSDMQPEAGGAHVDVELALDWLDRHAGWPPGTARWKVMSRLGTLNDRALRERNARRAMVGRSEVARALSGYYRDRCVQNLDTYHRLGEPAHSVLRRSARALGAYSLRGRASTSPSTRSCVILMA